MLTCNKLHNLCALITLLAFSLLYHTFIYAEHSCMDECQVHLPTLTQVLLVAWGLAQLSQPQSASIPNRAVAPPLTRSQANTQLHSRFWEPQCAVEADAVLSQCLCGINKPFFLYNQPCFTLCHYLLSQVLIPPVALFSPCYL